MREIISIFKNMFPAVTYMLEYAHFSNFFMQLQEKSFIVQNIFFPLPGAAKFFMLHY